MAQNMQVETEFVETGVPAGYVQTPAVAREELALRLMGGWYWETDHLHRVTYLSENFERLSGMSREWHYGKTRSDLGLVDFDHLAWRRYQAQIEARQPIDPIEYMRLRDGQPFWVKLVGEPRFDRENGFIGYHGIAFDITAEIKERHLKLEAESALALRRKELERTNRDLLEFAQIASHDLQEPLRKIETFGSRLVGRHVGELSVEGKMYVDRMIDAAGRMRKLITDLLLFSRSGRDLRKKKVRIESLIDEVRSDLQIRLHETDAEVRVGPLPEIQVDETQIRQLFQNLIVNGVKFRKNGVRPIVEISGDVVLGGQAGNHAQVLEIRVRDNGIGFDPAHKSKLFSMFQRLHGRNEYEGSGIGLAICRKIVEAHGGTIDAHAIQGEGAVFEVRLPME